MIKKIATSLSLYTLTSIVCAALSMLILPIMTHHLSTADYGTTSIISTYVLIVSPIIGLSAGGYFWIDFFDHRKEKKDLSTVFSSYFWFLSFMFIVFLLSIAIFRNYISYWAEIEGIYLLAIPLLAYTIELSDFSRALFINQKKPKSYFVYSVFFTLLDLGLSYYFVVFVFHTWHGRILGWMITLLIQAIFTLWIFGYVEHYLQRVFDKKVLYSMILYGYPIIFHQLGKFVINQSDRLFISKMISIDEAGIYSIGYQVGAMLLMPIGVLTNVYTPFLYERLHQLNDDNKIQIVKFSWFFIAVLVLCFAILNIMNPLFFKIMIDPKFHSGMSYVFWVSLSYVFWGFYMLFAAIVYFYKKTKFLGWLSIVNVVVNAILNYILIQRCGAIGAAYATMISFFIVLICVVLYANKFVSLPWFYFIKKNK
jgi:O-antigen/teichoic acid export membrane protein